MRTLADLKEDQLSNLKAGVTFEEYKALVHFDKWAAIEEQFGASN